MHSNSNRTETNLEALTIVQINKIKKQPEKQCENGGIELDTSNILKIQSIEGLQPKITIKI